MAANAWRRQSDPRFNRFSYQTPPPPQFGGLPPAQAGLWPARNSPYPSDPHYGCQCGSASAPRQTPGSAGWGDVDIEWGDEDQLPRPIRHQGRDGSPFLLPSGYAAPHSIPPGFGPPGIPPPGYGPPGGMPGFGTPYAFDGGAQLPSYNDPRYVAQWAPAYGSDALAPYGPEALVSQGLFPPGPLDVMPSTDGFNQQWGNAPGWANTPIAPPVTWGNPPPWANTPAMMSMAPPPPTPSWANTPMAPQFSPMQVPPDLHPLLFSKKDPYDGEYVSSRPPDWRHDYVPPRRFPLISRLKRVGSEKVKINLEHCHLAPFLLMPHSKIPVMLFDLRCDEPLDPLNLELLTTSGRPFNATDLTQLATTRPVRRLRFYHPRLPWYLDVLPSQPNGVLVGDVLQQLHEELHKPIRPQDFHNTVLNSTDRELITSAYRNRCDDRIDIMQQGVRRVDFMGSDVVLQGFMQGRDGMWLMKTTRFGR
ncbi:hypothetical protein C8F04DRAFT_1393306 [Mycena alexandri]|uniref:DUF6699 domain-containing protein n=1 Tax=Mycena alexandri TaxID=1745969 RepID=A0AAD6T190_9AGAR|nr:hypothetical protein C8F04DRAFT_1393306 [Mycena alexandri]